MQFSLIRALIGLLLLLFSLSMLVPLVIAFIYQENTHTTFLYSFAITATTGLLLWMPLQKVSGQLRVRDGFLITALFWVVLGLFGSLPFIMCNKFELSIVDGIFESVSGLTTTGSTVITFLDDLPKSILFYRQLLQWLGGIGIIVIAIAILPMLGVGGMQLYRAETPGPMKDNKLTPRIAGTAKVLFTIYLTMTLCCAIAYKIAGMNWFDAVSHSFSTVAIGGFSTHDASLGYFNNTAVLWVGSFFMLLAGINFGLHFTIFKNRSLLLYWKDSELRFYLKIIVIAIAIVLACLFLTPMIVEQHTSNDLVAHGIFQVISLATTTGFASTDYTSWPAFIPIFLFLLAFVGACAGSTGGGMKAIRVLLIIKQGYRELLRLIHPNAIIPLKLSNQNVPDSVVNAVWSFFSIYVMAFFILFLAVLATGIDFVTAFSAVGASINNLGPGLNEVAFNYSTLPDSTKWILCFAMLLGRLEVFTLLVLLTPAFWRK